MFQVRNRPWSSRSRGSSNITKPVIRSYFSVNKDREFIADLSEVKYLKCDVNNASHNFDLNDGYEERIPRPTDISEKMDLILKCIIKDYNKFSTLPDFERWLKPEFITCNSTITTIACTPYEKWNEWTICAAKFHGTIFFSTTRTPEVIKNEENHTEQHKRFLAWGLKFEQYIFSDDPNQPPDASVPNNESPHFYCMFSTKLNDHLLLYKAEIDGIDAAEVINESTDLNTCTLVEAKTRKLITSKQELHNFRRLIVHYWCQCYMTGIDKVLCGFRNDIGVVKELKYISISELRRMGEGFWSASECISFFDDFLSHIKKTVQKEHDQYIYKFYWKPGENVDMEILPAEHEYNFLPKWFCEQITTLRNIQRSNNDVS